MINQLENSTDQLNHRQSGSKRDVMVAWAILAAALAALALAS